jgi:hypothetical protein
MELTKDFTTVASGDEKYFHVYVDGKYFDSTWAITEGEAAQEYARNLKIDISRIKVTKKTPGS